MGIRELRQRASELLRLVAQGRTIEITDHGHPVALLKPVNGEVGPLERLRQAGAVRPASRRLEELPDPLPAGHGALPSKVLEAMRSEER